VIHRANILLTALLTVLLIGTTAGAEDEEPFLARIIDSDTGRVPLYTVAPTYPRKARRDRIEGEVQVCFEVDRAGYPRRVAVRYSSNRAFERPSTKAVRASTFKALGKDVPLPGIKSCRTFIFALEPSEP
jgi:TonB family protein